MKSPQNIWCIGRNYAEHAKELGNPVTTVPLIFLKAVGCLSDSTNIVLPKDLEEVHHELELVLRFSSDLKPGNFCFDGLALGLDLTNRKAQSELKAQGHPWELAKSFINAAPISPFFPVQHQEFQNFSFQLKVNQKTVQTGRTDHMLFTPIQIAQYLLQHFPVQPGDYLFTGTPAGVGPLRRGDDLEAVLLMTSQEGTELDSEILIQRKWKMI